MAELRTVEPVLCICGVLVQPSFLSGAWREDLARELGNIHHESGVYTFEFTNHYDLEMGTGLVRKWLALDLMDPAGLPDAKLATQRIEQAHAVGNGRRVNLDVGYLDFHKVVLASVKGAGHKVYLQKGIWADLVLRYQKGQWTTPAEGFADLGSGRYTPWFQSARDLYKMLWRARETA